MRITKVVTKIGDSGTTKLADSTEVSKTNIRIVCNGEIDELNSFIGYAKIAVDDKVIIQDLTELQNNLLHLGGELAFPQNGPNLLKNESVGNLEDKISDMNLTLPPLKEFVLPGGDEFSGRLHLARTVCRRVERQVINLIEQEGGRKLWIKYLNRLSDYLFVLARYNNHKNEIRENQWNK